MKTHCTVLLLFILLSITAAAQSDQQDVIYLKNGYIYRGKIVDRTQGLSYKLQLTDTYSVTIADADIDKVTKENKHTTDGDSTYQVYATYHYPNTGFILQGQIPFGFYNLGISALVGYKFHRFAQIGVSITAEYAASINSRNTALGDGYAPICAYYSGDILKKEFTPFYFAEFGYALSLVPNRKNVNYLPGDSYYEHTSGGLTGGIGLGCRYHPWYGKFSCSWSVNAHFLEASKHDWGTGLSLGSGRTDFDGSYSGTLYMISTQFSIGF